MPPDRTSGGLSKQKPKPFKPPRPSTTATSSKSTPSRPFPASSSRSKASQQTIVTTSSTSRPSRPSTSTNIFSTNLSDEEPSDADPDPESPDPKPHEEDYHPQAIIPPQLLTRLLHEFFADESMRISKGADRAVGKYMETFVREAIARAAFERESAGSGGGDRFLEVEDLEKLAPQLVLDF